MYALKVNSHAQVDHSSMVDAKQDVDMAFLDLSKIFDVVKSSVQV